MAVVKGVKVRINIWQDGVCIKKVVKTVPRPQGDSGLRIDVDLVKTKVR